MHIAHTPLHDPYVRLYIGGVCNDLTGFTSENSAKENNKQEGACNTQSTPN
jgi:hypothetical protein